MQGPSVARGYWNRPQLRPRCSRLGWPITARDPVLRTGDLGFFYDGQLFVTGRIKELIIVRGRNHYPQDIEFTAQSSHADLQADGGVAFAFERTAARSKSCWFTKCAARRSARSTPPR